MRILFLTQIIPYPLDAGPKVKTWHVLQYLANQNHEIHLLSFIRPEEKPFLPVMEKLCSDVSTVDIHRSRLADVAYWARSQISGRPFLIERDDIRDMRALVERKLAENAFDVIHADQLTMCQFALDIDKEYNLQNSSVIRVFDAHNAVWKIVKRIEENASFYLKIPLALEAKRIKRYEATIVSQFEQTLAVTEPDRQALVEAVNEFEPAQAHRELPISVIPIAANTNELLPVERIAGSKNILTLGTLHYPPNADGIRWFISEVFPLIQTQIPEVTLTIIGKNPPKDFLTLAAENPETIKVTGYVPDLIPYLENAGVLVVPVRVGGGMRVRILEALSYAMPVVTTTIGIEGIEAQAGRDVLIEDKAPDFAQAVVHILDDNNLQNALGTNGRRLIEKKYDWQVVLQKLTEIYQDIQT